MAAPHATGALALVMERYPYMNNEQALQVLTELLTNPGFRQRYEEKPAAALLEIGIPAATIANLAAACLVAHRIDPTLIGSRATLISLAIDGDAHQHELMSWQRELLKMI